MGLLWAREGQSLTMIASSNATKPTAATGSPSTRTSTIASSLPTAPGVSSRTATTATAVGTYSGVPMLGPQKFKFKEQNGQTLAQLLRAQRSNFKH